MFLTDRRSKLNMDDGPWPDLATARLFFGGLVRGDVAETAVRQWQNRMDVQALAGWLIKAEVAGLALARYGPLWPELRQALQADQFVAVAEWGLHAQTLEQLAVALREAGVTAVLLKGAALALTVYPQPVQRTMSDIDLWVQEEEMAAAVTAVSGIGFTTHSKADRPLALQQLAQGEIQLYRTAWAHGLVELHWSPFLGWWLQRVAQIDKAGAWERKQPLFLPEISNNYFQLAAEDMVIHLAVHMAVNHQLSMKALQGLLDVALTAQVRGVDWDVVAQRAKEWRVATAVYTVLHLLDQLVGAAGVEIALEQLRPSALRRRAIDGLVSPQSLLAAQDVRSGRARFALLLLLVDRPREMLTLIFRTLWPEAEWLAARYGAQPVSRWRHLWQVVRYGRI